MLCWAHTGAAEIMTPTFWFQVRSWQPSWRVFLCLDTPGVAAHALQVTNANDRLQLGGAFTP